MTHNKGERWNVLTYKKTAISELTYEERRIKLNKRIVQ